MDLLHTEFVLTMTYFKRKSKITRVLFADKMKMKFESVEERA